MADRIKALKATNSIEATPQRARQKHSTAEEPVTARIRRRQETRPASVPPSETDAGTSPAEASTQPQLTFQERLALERQQKSDGPNPDEYQITE